MADRPEAGEVCGVCGVELWWSGRAFWKHDDVEECVRALALKVAWLSGMIYNSKGEPLPPYRP